jgi:hypothetical protein
MAAKKSTKIFGAIFSLLVVAALGRAGYEKYLVYKQGAVAGPIAADLRAIRTTAFQVATISGWPADAALGVVPPALVSALGSTPFAREGVPYDWDLVMVDSAGTLVPVPMISARTTDPVILAGLQRRLRDEPIFVTDNGVTLIVSGASALVVAATPPPPRRRR